MKKIFILLMITVTLIPIGGVFAQSDPFERHIDSLCRAGLYEEAYQYAKQRWQSLSPDKSQAYKDATADYYATTFLFEMICRYQEKFEEALKLNEEMIALRKPKTDYFAIRNKIVCYSGLENYEKAAENRTLLYKAHKKKKLPCEYELCHYYNFDFFKIDTLNIWGYEWYDKLPKNRFTTSFTKVVYYVYSTNPDGSEKDQLYRLHLIMFHGTDMPFDYIMEKHISAKTDVRSSMYDYTYKENIDYEKLHNDVIEIVKGDKKNGTRTSSHYREIEDFNPDTVSVFTETIEAREKTEYVSTEPYQEFNLFYGDYKQLNISLNGVVKSVVQTEVPVSILKNANSSDKVYARQQTWKFSPTGHLSLCHINKTSMKNIIDYNFNDDSILSDDKYDSTDTIAYYSFNSIGQIRQVISENYNSKKTFEYDSNGHLTKEATYYCNNGVLSEKLITLNDDGKPVRVKYRRNGIESVGVIDSYCYDERGNMVAHQMNNKTAQWMDAFVYDSLGNVIFEGRCDGYKGDNTTCKCKSFHARHGYEYDDQHNMIRNYTIGNWKPSGWDNYYQYDSAGREIEYKHYDVRGKQRTIARHIQISYDPIGRMVRKKALRGSFRVNEAIFSYTRNAVLEEWAYDEYGNLVEWVVYETKVKPFKIVRYKYSYDQHGNWVKRVRYEGASDDSMTATEVLERRIEYYFL